MNRGIIEIAEIECMARIGVSGKERRQPQRLDVDVSVELDLQRAVGQDELEATVNYVEIVTLVEELTSGTTFSLIEALAGRIASEILLWDERIESVEIRVKKYPSSLKDRVSYVATRIRSSREEL